MSEEKKTKKIKIELKEETTSEEEFRKWKGLEEDWEDFNKKK